MQKLLFLNGFKQDGLGETKNAKVFEIQIVGFVDKQVLKEKLYDKAIFLSLAGSNKFKHFDIEKARTNLRLVYKAHTEFKKSLALNQETFHVLNLDNELKMPLIN